MSEKFLVQLFSKLKEADFKKSKYLIGFYKYYQDEKKKKQDPVTLFECYIEYITRNVEHKDNEKNENLKKLYDDIKKSILKASRNAEKDDGRKVAKINMKQVTKILSRFIEDSSIIVYEDPEQEYTEKDEEFMENVTGNIMDDIMEEVKKSGRKLPEPKPDIEFGQRNEMLAIWQDTRKKCEELLANEQLANLLTKIFYIDVGKFCSVNKPASQSQIDSILLQSDLIPQIEHEIKPDGTKSFKVNYVKEDILKSNNFASCYSKAKYNTNITLTNNQPIDDLLLFSKKKQKAIYVCSGSQNICGGNADQGINCTESMLYMTSSYSIALEKATHAYPLGATHSIICPNVLVFKDTKYRNLNMSEWQKVAIMNLPCKYKPDTNIKDLFKKDIVDDRLYATSTTISPEHVTQIKSSLIGGIELALFFGYDTIVLDDRGISDNWIPAHPVARIIKEVMDLFKTRVREFIISVPKSKSFNVMKFYFK